MIAICHYWSMTTRKERVYKTYETYKMYEMYEEYEVESIRNSTVFAKKSKTGQLSEICLPVAKSTWEPA